MNDDIQQQQIGGVPPELWLDPPVFAQIHETIGSRKAESGGMLGGDRQSGQVTAFYFDTEALEQSAGAYSPNHTVLTRILREEWGPRGIQLLGFVHSHPPTYNHPSPWDEKYAQTIIEGMGLPYLLLPIIRTVPDAGAFALFPYVAGRRNGGIEIIEQGFRIGEKARPFEKQGQEEETGTGKSNLLMRLMLQDIASGIDVCLLDPRRDVINDLLARIPADQIDDVILRERRSNYDR